MDTRHRALMLYDRINRYHNECVSSLQRLRADITSNLDLGIVVDVVGVLKKSDELLKDIRTETNKAVGQLSRVACALYLRSGSLGEPVRTEWLTASPDVKSRPNLPSRSKEPERYAQFCTHFGIAPDSPFRPHFPDMVEYVSQCEANHTPLPPGIEKDMLRTEYVVVCRFHKGSEPDALCRNLKEGDWYSED